MAKFLKYLLLLAVLVSCKKYPENNLWLKNPTNVLARGIYQPWILDFYSVDGIDSTQSNFLKAYREEGVSIYIEKGKPNLNWYRIADFSNSAWEFVNHKKTIRFKSSEMIYNSGSYSNQRNIFMQRDLVWEIQKLNKKEFFIKASYNSREYEIHFK